MEYVKGKIKVRIVEQKAKRTQRITGKIDVISLKPTDSK